MAIHLIDDGRQLDSRLTRGADNGLTGVANGLAFHGLRNRVVAVTVVTSYN